MSIKNHLAVEVARHTAKAAAKKEKSEPHKVSHFKVTPTTEVDGYHVETHFEHKGEYMGPHSSIHKSEASVAKHMKEMCGKGDTDNDGD